MRLPPRSTLFPYTTLFRSGSAARATRCRASSSRRSSRARPSAAASRDDLRSEEHTSELQSPYDLVCRLLLEKKNSKTTSTLQRTVNPYQQFILVSERVAER